MGVRSPRPLKLPYIYIDREREREREIHIYIYICGDISSVASITVRPKNLHTNFRFNQLCIYAYALPNEAGHAPSEATRVVTTNCTQHNTD